MKVGRGLVWGFMLGLYKPTYVSKPNWTQPGLIQRDPARGDHRFGFIPHIHHATYADKTWQLICSDIGFKYIDPLG